MRLVWAGLMRIGGPGRKKSYGGRFRLVSLALLQSVVVLCELE